MFFFKSVSRFDNHRENAKYETIVGHECGWKRKALKQLVFEPEVM